MLANVKKLDKFSDPISAFERLRETLEHAANEQQERIL